MAKEAQRDMHMEKLKSKACDYKSFPELAKALRMTILEKRYAIDNVERNQLQKCLDLLQQSIKVNSLQAMVERLESISRQLGLKFMAGQSGFDWFISSDMFYLEVVLEASGNVKDVKIHHEGRDQLSCGEFIKCLRNQDFKDFTSQLESLASIYQLNAEKKVKSKAFAALQSLEADLIHLASLQNNVKDPFLLIHKSPVGALQNRRGGHAMMLTYFVSPYNIMDLHSKTLKPLSVDMNDVGYHVTVGMESSCAHFLQITTLVTSSVNPFGKSTLSYSKSNSQNTASLPAHFVLKLNQPTPVSMGLVKKIQAVTEMDCVTSDIATPQPLLSLITQQESGQTQESDHNKPLFVSLPDQNHCYFMTENPSLQGILVTSIPFTHPSHVSQILFFLRQQALFNSLLASCIRSSAKPAYFEDLIMFEITPLSVQHLSISFEHPVEESLATAELDLSDITQLQCNVYAGNTTESFTTAQETSEVTSKVLLKSFSIPVTMRALIKAWQVSSSKNSLNNFHVSGGGGLSSFKGMGDINISEEDLRRPGVEGGFHESESYSRKEGGYDQHKKVKIEPSDDVMEVQMKPKSDNLFDKNMGSLDFPSYSPLQTESFPATVNPLSSFGNHPGAKISNEEKKSKLPDPLWSKKKDDDFIMMESFSNESTPLETSSASGMRNKLPGIEYSGVPDMLMCNDDVDEEMMEVNDLNDVQEFLKLSAKKIKKETGFSGMKLDEKMLPAVTLSPLPSSSQFNISGVNWERRPGIEIIPIANVDTLGRPLTETEQLRSERKIKSKSQQEKAKFEKKKKRKREDDNTAMGPPEKPAKIDSSKPSSSGTKSDLNLTRKYPVSPIPFSTEKSRFNNDKVLHKPSGSYCSNSSSKQHTSISPKQTSSGKPSLSALKSAVTSPTGSSSNSSKSDHSKSKSSSSSSSSSSTSSSSSSSSSSSKDFQAEREKEKKLISSSSGIYSHS